jgi:hypothetical protein
VKPTIQFSGVFRQTLIAAAVAMLVNVACAQDSGYGYGDQFVGTQNVAIQTDTVYRAPDYQSRTASVKSPSTIQGCDAGLIIVSGSYKCKSLALVSQGGLIPDPVVVYSYNGSGGSGSGGQQQGYLGSDGRVYSDPYQQNVMSGFGDVSYNNTTYQYDTNKAATGSGYGSTSSSSGSSRVICTHFYKKGDIARDVWKADLKFTQENLSETTVRGYHYWAIPYVNLMRRSKMAEAIMRPIAQWRAQELAYQMGVVDKGSVKGKLVRLVLEPVCYAIGCMVEQKDFNQLWTDADRAQLAAA